MTLLSSERLTRCRRPRPGDDLAARYDAVAARWHRTMQRLGYPHAYARLLDELRRRGVLHRRPPPSRVLDCGLGTGVLAAAFARAVPGVTTVTGGDLSLAMLHHAAANLAAAGVTAELQRADARCLPYRDGEFDAVLSAHVLEHLPAPLVALREMARVLRPGGLFIIVAVRANIVDAIIRLKWGHAPISPGDLARWMTLAGIGDVRGHPLGSPWTPARWLSRAFVGRKGSGQHHEEASSVGMDERTSGTDARRGSSIQRWTRAARLAWQPSSCARCRSDDVPCPELLLTGRDPLDASEWQKWSSLPGSSAIRKNVSAGERRRPTTRPAAPVNHYQVK